MNMLEKNKAFLQRYFPGLQEIIESTGALQLFDAITVVEGKRGIPTVKASIEGHFHFLHSQYNPIQEAERWAASNPIPKQGIVCMIGWGLGYHALEWMKQHGGNADGVIIIEPEPRLLLESFAVLDLEPLMNSPRVEFAAGCDPHRLQTSFMKFNDIILNRDVHAVIPPFADLYPDHVFQTIQTELRRFYDSKQRMLNHMQEMGNVCQSHLIHNIPAMAKALFPRDIRDRLSNEPAVIVGAGPSLNHNISHLKAAQTHAWIFAVDTSARILIKQGIEPHVVVTKDPSELNARHFAELILPMETLLAFDPQVVPNIPDSHAGPLLCMPNRNHEIHNYLSGLELTETDLLPLSNNVALAALNLAIAAGCSPIILTGMDFCFEQNKSHADGSALLSDVALSEDGSSLVYKRGHAQDTVAAIHVEGLTGQRHPTTKNLHDALRFLEQLIQTQTVPCIDASEGGAKIAGTQILTLQEALNQHAQHPISRDNLSTLSPPVRDRNALNHSILLVANHLDECKKTAWEALEVLHEDSQANVSSLQTLREKIERGFKIYHELQAALERLIVEVNQPEFWNETKNQPQDLYQRYEMYFHVIHDVCETYAAEFRQIAQS